MSASAKIIELRQLLAERFPAQTRKAGTCIPTGIARLDELLEGGLWKGALTELTSPLLSAGSASIAATILHTAAAEGRGLALIDGSDSFDPQPIDNSILTHLLWVRCHEAAEAMRAADLLLRDGNLPLVLLDLRGNPAEQLRKIPGAGWYRLQRIVEQSGCACLVITPHPMVSSAQVKLTLENRFELSALSQDQNELLERLQIDIARQRFLQQNSGLRIAEAG